MGCKRHRWWRAAVEVRAVEGMEGAGAAVTAEWLVQHLLQ